MIDQSENCTAFDKTQAPSLSRGAMSNHRKPVVSDVEPSKMVRAIPLNVLVRADKVIR